MRLLKRLKAVMNKFVFNIFFCLFFAVSGYGAIENIYTTSDCDSISLMVIAVETDIYEALDTFPELDQFIKDIESEKKYRINLITVENSSHTELYAYLQSKISDNIEGVLFIGDLPVAYFEIERDYGNGSYASFPCDLYYMELDGDWLDSDSNGIYDLHTPGSGDYKPEIWLGRLTSSTIYGTSMDEVGLIRNYLSKNHAYRTGQLTSNHRAFLAHDRDWDNWNELYLDQVYSDVTLITEGDIKSYYTSALTNYYEYIHVSVHSSTISHSFSSGSLSATSIPGIDPTTFFYSLYACSNCKYTSSNYMGGHYIFTQNRGGLAAVGSTKVGGMLGYHNYHPRLATDLRENIGEAFRYWFDYHSLGYTHNISWSYGMTLIGDPTLSIDIPIASITSSFTEATRGDKMDFSGTGNIHQGNITDYLWSSSIDGVLSDQSDFTIYLLSEGTHKISFQVKDNLGRWSTAVEKTVTIYPALLTQQINPSGHIETTVPEFQWHSDNPNYDYFEIKVTNPDKDDIVVFESNLSGSSWTLPDNDGSLSDGYAYQWWIRGISMESDNEAWQGPVDFQIMIRPSGISPSDELWVENITDFNQFQWQSTTAPYAYNLLVTETGDTTPIISESGISGSSWTLPQNENDLEFGISYEWKIQGVLNGQYSTHWSEQLSFMLIDNDDTTPPVTVHDFENEGEWINFNASITLTATDDINNVKETKYKILDNDAQTGTLIELEEGIFDIEYWSIDNANNEESHKNISVLTDTTMPETTDDYGSGDGTIGGDYYPVEYAPITITLTPTDNLSGIRTTWHAITYYGKGESYGNNYDEEPPVESTSITLEETGNYNLRYWSIDNADNKEYDKYIYAELVEEYVPPLIYPKGNVTMENWLLSPEFSWELKLSPYIQYDRYGNEQEVFVSDYIYEIEIYSVDNDGTTLVYSQSDLTRSNVTILNAEQIFEEGTTYLWKVRTKYQYQWKASDWSENWSNKMFTIAKKDMTSITLNDNDTVTLTWGHFNPDSLFKIANCADIENPSWSYIDPTEESPIAENSWTGGQWEPDNESYYRVIAVIPDIASISPVSLQRGTGATIDIAGNYTQWQNGEVEVNFGDRITVNSTIVLNPTLIRVEITIDADARVGSRLIRVNTPSSELNYSFSVDE